MKKITKEFDIENFCNGTIELIAITKLNCNDYEGQHYTLKMNIDLTKSDEIEAKAFLGLFNPEEGVLGSINSIMQNQFDGAKLDGEKESYNLFCDFIDKNEEINDKKVIESLVESVTNAFEFAVAEICSYDSLTSYELKNELMNKYEVEITDKENQNEQNIEELILKETGNYSDDADNFIMPPMNGREGVNDDIMINIGDEAIIRIKAEDLFI